MRLIYTLFMIPIIPFILTGCGDDQQVIEHEEHENIAVTRWTDKSELFMEYEELAAGQATEFITHLTVLKDFSPVTVGKVTYTFIGENGETVQEIAEAPVREGIYLPSITIDSPGTYNLTLTIDGPQLNDSIIVGEIHVHDGTYKEHTHEGDANAGSILFLKEQQWKIDFRTEPVRKHTLSASVRAVGEIISPPLYHSEVAAPVSGMIHADRNARIPAPGTWVRKGMVLTVISPLPDTKSDIMRIHTEYLLAKAEFERSQRLYAEQAISEKRIEEARLGFEAKKVSNDVIAWHVDYGLRSEGEKAIIFYQVKAPIDGFIEEINIKLGQTIQAGEKLYTITNLDRVLLKAHVPLIHISEIKNTSNASFTIEGYDEEFEVARLNGRLISFGSKVDKESRTVPVIYELDNPENQLKIGMFADVSIKTGDVIEMLAVPTSAVYNENDTNIAYVHVEGESFAKRMIKTGITDRGYTEIIEGIAEGERVVTLGGYQIRLSSLSTIVPSGHGHGH